MTKQTTPFEEGYRFAETDEVPRNSFYFSNKDPEYGAGYIVRVAESESNKAAYAPGFAISCAQMAVEFNVSPDLLRPHIADEDRAIFETSYQDAWEAACEEAEKELEE